MVVSHHCTDDDGFVPLIVQVHFSNGDIEFPMQPGDERLDPPAFVFERGAAGNVEVDGECGEQVYSVGGGGGRMASRSGIKAGVWTVAINHMRSCLTSSYS